VKIVSADGFFFACLSCSPLRIGSLIKQIVKASTWPLALSFSKVVLSASLNRVALFHGLSHRYVRQLIV